MKKALLTAAIIASLGTASVAQGLEPVLSTQSMGSSPESLRGLGAGSLGGQQTAILAAFFGISVLALVAILNDDDGTTDGTTSGTN